MQASDYLFKILQNIEMVQGFLIQLVDKSKRRDPVLAEVAHGMLVAFNREMSDMGVAAAALEPGFRPKIVADRYERSPLEYLQMAGQSVSEIYNSVLNLRKASDNDALKSIINSTSKFLSGFNKKMNAVSSIVEERYANMSVQDVEVKSVVEQLKQKARVPGPSL
jgi:hypothetical protein